jgi:hypothetical protein
VGTHHIASGRPGFVILIRAGSCELAFEQLMLRVRQSRGGQGLSRDDIRALVSRVVDAVVRFEVDGGERFIEEISTVRWSILLLPIALEPVVRVVLPCLAILATLTAFFLAAIHAPRPISGRCF